MRQFLKRPVMLILLASSVAWTNSGCGRGLLPSSTAPSPSESPLASSPTPSPVASTSSPASSTPTQPDPFQLAVNRASSAFTISQAARSQDDWRLVASRWQQAIDLLGTVPASSPYRPQVQNKLVEYRRNLAFAQQQASRSTASANPDGVIVIGGRSQSDRLQPAPQTIAALPSNGSGSSGSGSVFAAPIVRRAGGTPVINVTFNGDRQFEMIVDTGASGTVITQPMAAALGVVPVGEARVDTASARNVAFPLGYVNSIEVDGAMAQRVLVAIAGPDLSVGLLGHDFFNGYDVTIRQNVVEFRER